MTARKLTNFRIDADLVMGLKALKARDGVPVSESVRRALRAWLTAKGVMKADRTRTVTRKRS